MLLVSKPNVYTFILGINDKIIPESVKPINTKINILNGLNLSPSQPPIGRIIVASTMNPAVRIPASTSLIRSEILESLVSIL